LIEAVKEAEVRGAGYFDYEVLYLSAGEWSATIPIELTPPELVGALRLVEALLHEAVKSDPPWDPLAMPRPN
jgi:hypothetical protein